MVPQLVFTEEVGKFYWGDHPGAPDPLNFFEITGGEDEGGARRRIAVKAEAFIRLLLRCVECNEPFVADLWNFEGCAGTGTKKSCGGPRKKLAGAFRWDPHAENCLTVRNFGLNPERFCHLVRWLAKLPPWDKESIRPFALREKERTRFRELAVFAEQKLRAHGGTFMN